MAKKRLNEKSIRHPAPASGQVELWDDLLDGFGLRISAGGSRSYFVMKRLNGKLTRRTVGKAPGLDIAHGSALPQGFMWPADARKAAKAILAEMAAGNDPGKIRVARAPSPQLEPDEHPAMSFAWVAKAYLADTLNGGGAGLKSKAELERKLKVDLAAWRTTPISDLRSRDIRQLVRNKAQESPIAANRLLSFIKRVFRWAVSQDYLDADPAAAVDKPGRETVRDRFLSEDEIRVFWKACDRLGDPIGRLGKLALVTLQRRGEVAGLRRSELGEMEYRMTGPRGRDTLTKGRVWLLSAERTKRGVAHTVPLSTLAATLIDEAPKLLVDDKVSDHVFLSGRRGDQGVTGWSKFKLRLDRAIGEVLAEEAGEEFDPEKHQFAEPWHLHDLRATGATHMEMERLGIARPVISRILNHSEGDGRSMTARYTRHKWHREAADALEAWAQELKRIVGANVVSFQGATDQG